MTVSRFFVESSVVSISRRPPKSLFLACFLPSLNPGSATYRAALRSVLVLLLGRGEVSYPILV